jgi:hypothetical protein
MTTQSPFANKSSLLSSLLLPGAAILGSLVAFGVFNGMGKVPHSHVQASAVQKAEPPRKAGPLITKIEPAEPVVAEAAEPESEPVLEPKSFEAAPEAEPEAAELEAVEAHEEALVEEVPIETIEAPMPVPVEKKASSEETFEQYRQAMLHTGPRDLENQARVEMQSKGGVGNSALWRAQTASLRKSLGDADAAEFLERANMSVNDRVISSFNAYRDA